jgi:hypothetical protein
MKAARGSIHKSSPLTADHAEVDNNLSWMNTCSSTQAVKCVRDQHALYPNSLPIGASTLTSACIKIDRVFVGYARPSNSLMMTAA